MTALILTLLALPTDGGRALGAILEYHTRTVGTDGVTHETRHQDRFYREAGHVWIERVLPARSAERPVASGHEVDLSRVARHMVPAASGAAHVELIGLNDKLIIDVAPLELTRVEASGRWDDAWYLLSSSQLQSLHPTGEKAPAADQRWLERREGGEIVRVLWSDALSFPLIVERTRTDGSRQASVRASVIPLPTVRPWTRTSGFKRKDLADFGD